jgi:hypothetical protein
MFRSIGGLLLLVSLLARPEDEEEEIENLTSEQCMLLDKN